MPQVSYIDSQRSQHSSGTRLKTLGVNNRAKGYAFLTLSHLLNKYLFNVDCAPGCVPGEGIHFADTGKLFPDGISFAWLWNSNITFFKHFLHSRNRAQHVMCIYSYNSHNNSCEMHRLFPLYRWESKVTEGKWRAQLSQLVNRPLAPEPVLLTTGP